LDDDKKQSIFELFKIDCQTIYQEKIIDHKLNHYFMYTYDSSPSAEEKLYDNCIKNVDTNEKIIKIDDYDKSNYTIPNIFYYFTPLHIQNAILFDLFV